MRSTHRMQSKYPNVPRLQCLGDRVTQALAHLHLDTLSLTLVPVQHWAKRGEALSLCVT